jgi:predicted Zn finger-like uncharacterized protein
VLGNLDRAAADLAEVAAKINRGDGTLGKLVNDPALYHDTHALVGRARKSWLLRWFAGGTPPSESAQASGEQSPALTVAFSRPARTMRRRMTVECPRCGTVYRRPARAERGADESYRCARCRHVFVASRDEPVMVSEAEEPGDDEEQFAFDDEEREDEPEAPPAPTPRAPRDPPPRTMTAARFAVRSMVLVTLGYGVLSVYLYTHPRDRGRPARGPADRRPARRDALRPTAVQLTNLRGEYERVQGDRSSSSSRARAVNNSAVPVRGVQIEGRIAGAQEQRQVVFCGAAPRDVHDLSLREIALLQTLEPPKEWSLRRRALELPRGLPDAAPELHEFGPRSSRSRSRPSRGTLRTRPARWGPAVCRAACDAAPS